MFTSPTASFAKLLLPLALVGATTGFVAGCGSGGIDKAKLDDVKKQGQQLQQQSADAQKQIQQISADIKSGKISAEAGQKKIDSISNGLEKKAKNVASNGIDAVKNSNYLSDADKKQLKDAQAQLSK
ncbi:MAG: hypothetical protein AAGC46_19150 [Solirubrobacteraceae bacterium]|nr:hypothetical protein [Patulibacter sp.]